MASTFKNARQQVGTSYTTIYTCPAATTAIVTLLQIANIHASASADISIQYLDSSASNAATRLALAIPVASKTAIIPIGGKLVLEAGDALQLLSSSTSSLEGTLSVLELS